jgi:hypothetical protein
MPTYRVGMTKRYSNNVDVAGYIKISSEQFKRWKLKGEFLGVY